MDSGPPTYTEMSEWFTQPFTYAFLTSQDGMNANSTFNYASSLSSGATGGFVMVSLKNNKVSFVNTSSGYSSSKVKCVLDNTKKTVNIQVPSFDLRVGNTVQFSVTETNTIGYYWSFAIGDKKTTASTQSYGYVPGSSGCACVTVKAQLWSGKVIANCFAVFVMDTFGNDKDLKVSVSSIKQQQIATSVVRKTGFHFGSNSAPIAPIGTGGAFIVYTSTSSLSLNLITVSSFSSFSTPVDLGIRGYPFDIVAISSTAFILLASANDTNKLFVQRRDLSGSSWDTTWNIVIMDNGGSNPPAPVNQLYFFKNGSISPMKIDTYSDAAVGTFAMAQPHNGRLAVGRNRVGMIFAHYNNFAAQGFHTGDTFLSVDIATGKDIRTGWTWQTSHSLIQQSLYNGRKFLLAALSDAYPKQSITFSTINVDSTSLKTTSSLVSGLIPGKSGFSCGRLGGLVQMSENLYALTYSRRGPCSSSATDVNTINEMSVLFFDDSLNLIRYKQLLHIGNVNVIKMAKLGNRLLIGYVLSTSTDEYLPAYLRNSDTMYIMMINQLGNVIIPPFNVSYSGSANDDWRVEQSGAVMWTYVDTSGRLSLYWINGEEDTTPANSPTYNDHPWSDGIGNGNSASSSHISLGGVASICLLFFLYSF